MLRIVGVVWVLLALAVVVFTAAIVMLNPAPTVKGGASSAELWLRALPMVTTFVVTMAGVRFFGGTRGAEILNVLRPEVKSEVNQDRAGDPGPRAT